MLEQNVSLPRLASTPNARSEKKMAASLRLEGGDYYMFSYIRGGGRWIGAILMNFLLNILRSGCHICDSLGLEFSEKSQNFNYGCT